MIIFKLLWKHTAQKARGVLKWGKTPLLLSQNRNEEQANQCDMPGLNM